jgi:RNA polymerase sigma-70 factor (ECF subfamily)
VVGNPGLEDQELIVDSARGSREAFAKLYDRHSDAVSTIARRLLGNSSDVNDLVHDVFIEAWQRAGDYDPARGSVRSWLLVRARSRCIDRRKSPAMSRRGTLDFDPVADASVTVRVESYFDSQVVRAALDRLPFDQRAAIVLGFCEGLSSSEIALKLDVPVGTVKSRVHAAMLKLRVDLGVDRPT